MQFETVFDVTQTGYRYWWFPACGVVVAALGIFFVCIPRLTKTIFPSDLNERSTRVFGWIFMIFGLIWTAGTLNMTLGDYIAARDALISGQVTVTEGVVTDFRPMPYSGHAHESFAVAGQRFFYSDYALTSGFNNTRSHGGPIDNGVYVRIAHRGNTILRLEIGR